MALDSRAEEPDMISERVVPITDGRGAGPPTTDAALVARMVAGDRLAMQVLFARHHIRVYRFLLRLVNNSTVAEDLIGETFLAAWRRAHTFHGRSLVSTWLLAIARHKAFTVLRKRRDDQLDDMAAQGLADEASDPERMIQVKTRSIILRDCLRQLSSDHREVIDLVYYHQKSIEEVSVIIGIPNGTVKSRMFCARKSLAKILAARSLDREYLD
jgi:RNA polymerase sigma-70 factor (ECF subfamily)